jgi:hypothetical protein
VSRKERDQVGEGAAVPFQLTHLHDLSIKQATEIIRRAFQHQPVAANDQGHMRSRTPTVVDRLARATTQSVGHPSPPPTVPPSLRNRAAEPVGAGDGVGAMYPSDASTRIGR